MTPAPHRRRSLTRAALRRLLPGLAALMLAACATAPPAPATADLLHDELFDADAQRVDIGDVFALSDEMRRYADRELSVAVAPRDPRRALIAALYGQHQLRLNYDSGWTLNAAQAYSARSGNCLSLVIMTAAFARYLDLPVRFQSVQVDATYSRQGDLFLAAGHVNLVLDPLQARGLRSTVENSTLTVDFLPQSDLAGQRITPIDEKTIVAMYANNRSAEALSAGRLAEAYGWSRQALKHAPDFLSAANTLAVIYARAGHVAQAETALRRLLQGEPDNTAALSNLVGLLGRAGRAAEAQAISARLAQLQPVPPFHHFDLGRQAMAEGDPQRALDLFKRELRRQPLQDEVHFWAAQAYGQLGQAEQAARHLRLAMENSVSRSGQDRYAAKLASLRAAAPR